MKRVETSDGTVFPAAPRVAARLRWYPGFAAMPLVESLIFVALVAPGSVLGWLLAIGLGGLVLGIGFAVGIGYSRTKVVITDDEVVLHNLWESTAYPMDAVVGFEIASRWRGTEPFFPSTSLRLTPREHGIPRSIRIAALSWDPDKLAWNMERQTTSVDRHRAHVAELTPTVAAMNAELDRRRPDGPSTAERLVAANPPFKSIGWHDKD